MTTRECDIAICGAGIVGLTAACLLVKYGFRVLVLDRTPIGIWRTDQVSPRVSAINIASINLLKHIDVWNSIEAMRSTPYTHMEVWEDQQAEGIAFDSLEFNQSCLGAIVENNVLIQAIHSKLSSNYQFEFIDSIEPTVIHDNEKHIELTLSNQDVVHCKLLIGADGANSKIRDLARINSDFYDYSQDAIVTTITMDNGHQDTAWQCFTPTGPVALLPFKENQCSIVWSADLERSEQLMLLNEIEFCERLNTYFEVKLGSISGCEKRIKFGLKQHHAQRYIDNRIALIGDAAHATHPLAGLGVNIGLLDAAALAEVICDAKQNNRHIGQHSVLRRYERWRRGENELVLQTMKAFKQVFSSPSPAIQATRQTGLRMADSLSPLKNQLAGYAMGIVGDLPRHCR